MALSTLTYTPKKLPGVVVPIAPANDWVLLVEDCSTTDNATAQVVNPGGVSTTGRRYFRPNAAGTTLMLHMKYATDHTTYTTQCVIQVFGKDRNGVWHKLRDVLGVHELTMTAVNASDIDDGTNAYTDPVEVDLDGSVEVLVCVKTAFNGNGASDAATSIWGKVK